MKPLLVLSGSFVALALPGYLGLWPHGNLNTALRWAVALMFGFTALAHFVSPLRQDLVRMVPPSLPAPGAIITVTGLLEIAGAVGMTIPRVAPVAAAGLAVLLLAMFPANVSAARRQLTLHGSPVTPLVPRTILQVVFLTAVVMAGRGLP